MSLTQISALDTARSGSETTAGIASNGTTQAGSGTELRNEFLQMMVAQIQNQDPLNPLDGTQYVSQLAQFSMVEGVENLKVLQQKNLAMQDTQQVLASTQLVGKEVMVPTQGLTLEKEQPVRGQVYLAQAADAVELKVYNRYGQLVTQQQWGAQPAGALSYDVKSLPAGEYSFEVVAKQGGVLSQAQNYVASTVERVTLPGTGEVRLDVAGVGSVPLFSAVEFGKG
ncbi:MAG: flagellar hook assembly protein FlgD [Aeromonadaceae bacterium]